MKTVTSDTRFPTKLSYETITFKNKN